MSARQHSSTVKLIDEAVDVWRPVKSEQLHDDVNRIAEQPYDSPTERWEFEPRETVFAELIDSSQGAILAATRVRG